MGDMVCRFSKFGYCKYKESCHKRYFTEECPDLSKCQNIKNCPKIHPKICKQYVSGSYYIFKSDCSYDQKESTNKEEIEGKLCYRLPEISRGRQFQS